MDDYSTDLDVDGHMEDDVWAGEENICLTGIPMELWSDAPTDRPPEEPAQWVDDLADKVEIQRLCNMQVLVAAKDFSGEVTGRLTTKFVRDWRLKDFGEGSNVCKKWMRRSRFVAREFANTRRLDTFSPATGAHTSNILPLKYLWMKNMAAGLRADGDYSVVMGALDVRDAFLQVEQDEKVLVHLQNEPFIIMRNLPGQRLGAKQWYLHLREFLEKTLGFEFCPEQPCLARTKDAAIMIHVDDILYVGTKQFWDGSFLKEMKSKFTVSHEQLEGPGSSIKFLRRKMIETTDGLVLMPGTTVERVVNAFESVFGSARLQKVPSDSGIQLTDTSPHLNDRDSSMFRSIIGLCLYIGRERPDLMYTIKELASHMSCPTVAALGRLRKMIGFMKQVGDIGVKLCYPEPGVGKVNTAAECEWILESFSDADWNANKTTRHSTSCGVHFINNCFMYASSRNQKVVSLSSCESELHSLVSCACDGIYIRACAMFVLNGVVEHFQYTDSSSARQIACRQGCGRVRHVSGKLLWAQEKTADKSFSLHPVATLHNVADIGTKTLARQRLFYLLHSCGLVYGVDFSDVGETEFSVVNERYTNAQQLKKISKAILRMGLAMGITEGLESSGAMAQQCGNNEIQVNKFPWMFACVVFLICMAAFTAFWRRLQRFLKDWDDRMKRLESDVDSAQVQLGDHYEYAAHLSGRIDSLDVRCESIDEALDAQAAQIATLEEEMLESSHSMEELMDCIRYGLMELGGFVRHTFLNREQRSHMFVQERANMVLWNLRNQADTTDVAEQSNVEGGEEELGTSDPEIEPESHVSPGRITALLENVRRDLNIALQAERWTESNQLQGAVNILLDATNGPNPEGLSMRVVRDVRNIFQRLFRIHRNRGLEERRDRFRVYVEDMNSLMQ